MARPKKQHTVANPPSPVTLLQEPFRGFDRTMSCADADGVIASAPVDVYLHPADGRFSVKMPRHLFEHYDRRTEVFADRLVDLVQEFEQLNESYSISILHAKATKPMLMVALRDGPSMAVEFACKLGVGVMMGVTRVSVNPALPDRIYLREGDKALSIIVNRSAVEPYILLPDTPEIDDRLKAMSGSIADAAQVLRTLIDAPDPAAVLMSMDGPWTPQASKVDTPAEVVPDTPPVVTAKNTAFANDDDF